MSLREALVATIQLLSAVSVPVGMYDQIGRPVAEAISNLAECIKAMDAAKGAEPDGDAEV